MYGLIIVEDEVEIRNGLVECFPWAELGFNIVTDFDNGKDAIAWLECQTTDVILTDVKMANGSGIDVAEYISRNERLETIVFYSAYKDFDYARKGIQYGVKRYITKDMDYNEMINAFKQVKNDLDKELTSTNHIDIREKEYTDPVINRVLQHMTKSYRICTLQSSAKIVQLNPYYLSTYIKTKTGYNFRDILTRIRMKKAAELLKDPTYRTNEISYLVGYSDVRNFIRCFKNYYNMTPGVYKRQKRYTKD